MIYKKWRMTLHLMFRWTHKKTSYTEVSHFDKELKEKRKKVGLLNDDV